MLFTRREFLDDFLAQMAASDDPRARDRAERLLNRSVNRIWSRHPWLQFISSRPHTFTTVATQRSYPLPDWFGRVFSEDDSLRNVTARAPILPVDPLDLAREDPTQGTTEETASRPDRYYIAGVTGVHTQPDPAGEALEVLSSSVADTTIRVVIEGLNAAGDSTREQFTLTGTTPLAVGTWSHLDHFSKSYPEGTTPTTELSSSVGSVTLRKVAGAVELQKLLSFESGLELSVLNLYPVPNVTDTIVVPVFRRPKRLRFDADPIPRDWENALFEEMTIQWRVGSGKISHDSGIPRPALTDLICLDNMSRQNMPRVPWMG